MTFQEEIAVLKNRIGKAEVERDTWRTSGMQDKYLEAYSLVQALELQLERMRQEGLGKLSTGEPERSMAESSIAHEGRQYQLTDESERRLMAELDITFQDGVYHLGTYRYERLADAVNYARLRRLNGPAR